MTDTLDAALAAHLGRPLYDAINKHLADGQRAEATVARVEQMVRQLHNDAASARAMGYETSALAIEGSARRITYALADPAPRPAATEPDMCPVKHCDPDHCGVHTEGGCTWRTEPADTCRPVEVDGETIRVRGSGEFTERDHEFAAEIVRAARRKHAAEHPETDQPKEQ